MLLRWILTCMFIVQPSIWCSISTFRPGEAFLDLAMANVDVDWAGAADAQEKVCLHSIFGKSSRFVRIEHGPFLFWILPASQVHLLWSATGSELKCSMSCELSMSSGFETNGWTECQQRRCPCCRHHISGWEVPSPKGFYRDFSATLSQVLCQVIRKSLVENKNDLEIQRKDPNCPLYSVKSFEELNLQPNLLKGVYAMGFNAPSKIQVTLPLYGLTPSLNLPLSRKQPCRLCWRTLHRTWLPSRNLGRARLLHLCLQCSPGSTPTLNTPRLNSFHN